MNNDIEKFETILADALEAYDTGTSLEDIYKKFPEYRHDLEEVFHAQGYISQKVLDIKPSHDFARSLLESIVTGGESERSNAQEVASYTWFSSWKIFVPVGVAAVLIIGVFVSRNEEGSQTIALNSEHTQDEQNIAGTSPQIEALNEDSSFVKRSGDSSSAPTMAAAPLVSPVSVSELIEENEVALASEELEINFDDDFEEFFISESELQEFKTALDEF